MDGARCIIDVIHKYAIVVPGEGDPGDGWLGGGSQQFGLAGNTFILSTRQITES